MKVLVRDPNWSSLPEDVRPFVSRTQRVLVAGALHEVFAVSVYRGVSFLLVADEAGDPVLMPACVFATVDSRVRGDWICNTALGEGMSLVLGPDFLARDQGAYDALIDLEPEAVMGFRRYARSIERRVDA